jgi:outer membrane biosynthesis protein TonB
VAFLGTLTLHGTLLAVALWAPPAVRNPVPPVYRVELVAAPRPEPQRQAPEAVQRPAEPPAPAETEPRRTSVARTPPPPVRARVEREPAPRTNPTELAPGEKPSTGADVATVKTTGVDFPHPEYLRNIVAQIYRRWRRPTGTRSYRAEILFFVHRDGSISHLQFVTRSGSFAFDLEAQGAIEAAGNAGAFGPLPQAYPADVLPVSFFFDPERTP